jgi:hypothetical protein
LPLCAYAENLHRASIKLRCRALVGNPIYASNRNSIQLFPDGPLGGCPALHSPRLEHPLGEFQKRAVRAADHGAALRTRTAPTAGGEVRSPSPFPARADRRATAAGSYRLTGKPLGVTGGIAECVAALSARLLSLARILHRA